MAYNTGQGNFQQRMNTPDRGYGGLPPRSSTPNTFANTTGFDANQGFATGYGGAQAMQRGFTAPGAGGPGLYNQRSNPALHPLPSQRSVGELSQ